MNIFLKTLLTTFILVGPSVSLGLLIGYINKKSNIKIHDMFGRKGTLITGIIGTPVHELSHYIMAILFRHKVTEVRFFKPISSRNDGILGYVNHSYNQKSLYQNIGNFFIGIAPIFIGTTIIIIISIILFPEIWSLLNKIIDAEQYHMIIKEHNLKELLLQFNFDISIFFKNINSLQDINIPRFLFFIFIAISIVNHMSLSRADLEGAMSGIIFIMLTIFTFYLVSFIFKLNTNHISTNIIMINIYIFIFLSISLILSLLYLTLCNIIYKVIKFQ